MKRSYSKEELTLFEIIMVEQENSSAYFSVIPEYGAHVNEVVLVKNNRPVSILEGEKFQDTMVENKWYRGAKLFPFANRVLDGQYTFDNQKYQLPINFHEQYHAIHGIVYNLPFKVIRQRNAIKKASITLQLIYKGNIQGYPFPFVLELSYVLQNQKEFTCTTKVINTGSSPMPFSDGWHPYFTLESENIDELMLHLPSSQLLTTDNRQIPDGFTQPFTVFDDFAPIGNTVFDDCFQIPVSKKQKATTILINPAKDLTLSIWQDCTPNTYQYVQVFTPPNRKSIAIEPMTSAPNAFNNHQGLQILQPDEVFSASFGVVLS